MTKRLTAEDEEGRHDHVRPALIRFELQAIADVLRDWSDSSALDSKYDIWMARLPELRKAMLVGLRNQNKGEDEPRGQTGPLSEIVAREISADEYQTIREIVTWLRRNSKGKSNITKWLDCLKIPFDAISNTGSIELLRPCPTTADGLGQLALDLQSSLKPSEIAYHWTAFRLKICDQTVKNAAGSSPRDCRPRQERTVHQRWLASQFLDLCSPSILPHRLSTQKMILGSLKQSGYPPLMLYYLVRVGHDVRSDLAQHTATDEELSAMCDALTSIFEASPRTE